MFNPRHALLLDESRFPIPRHWRRQAARFPVHCHDGGRRKFRPVSTLIPRRFRPVAGHIPNVFQPIPIMIPFNSIEASQAVTEFIPCRRQKFKTLNAAKEIIAALRQKGASHTSIAELLARHCLSTGKTNVAEFCHAVLGESVRAYKRRKRKPRPVADLPVAGPITLPRPEPVKIDSIEFKNSEITAIRPRGPHIAQIRRRKPPTT